MTVMMARVLTAARTSSALLATCMKPKAPVMPIVNEMWRAPKMRLRSW